MTALSGVRVLNEGKDRLFDPMHRVLIIIDGIGIALTALITGRLVEAGKYAVIGCRQFPIEIKAPVLTPTQALACGSPMTEIGFFFGPKEATVLPPGQTQTNIKGYGHPTLVAVTPIYVDFFEKHKGWLRATLGGDPNTWPPLFNFARAVRNFISHHAGHVHFDNPNAPSVTWHHLTYMPADEGKQVIGSDIDLGDLIVLLFELSDELDRLGCPLNP